MHFTMTHSPVIARVEALSTCHCEAKPKQHCDCFAPAGFAKTLSPCHCEERSDAATLRAKRSNIVNEVLRDIATCCGSRVILLEEKQTRTFYEF